MRLRHSSEVTFVVRARCVVRRRSVGRRTEQGPGASAHPSARRRHGDGDGEVLGIVTSVRPLSDGRVLVNDPFGRRVLLFDAKLAELHRSSPTRWARTANTYGGAAPGSSRYRGDSTLFVDPQSLSMLVLDPAGKVARVMSVPSAQDAMSFAGVLGAARHRPAGPARLSRVAAVRLPRRGPGAAGGPPRIPEMPDSAAIFRIDLATRKVDTRRRTSRRRRSR